MLEYTVLLIFIVLAIFATQVYTKRAFMGYWRQMTDTFGFGRQYGGGCYCGDGTCNCGETTATCPNDCLDPCAGDHCGDGICNCGETSQTCSDCFIPPSNLCWSEWCWTFFEETSDPCLPVNCNVCEPDPPVCQPCYGVKENCCHPLAGGGCQYYHCNDNAYNEGCS